MSTSSTPPILPGDLPQGEAESSVARFRESVADSLFAVSRTFPRLLTLGSTPRAWTVFRIMLRSLAPGWSFFRSAYGMPGRSVGLALFVRRGTAPLRQDRGTPQAIEQLGAYLVLDADAFLPAERSARLQLPLALRASGSDGNCVAGVIP